MQQDETAATAGSNRTFMELKFQKMNEQTIEREF